MNVCFAVSALIWLNCKNCKFVPLFLNKNSPSFAQPRDKGSYTLNTFRLHFFLLANKLFFKVTEIKHLKIKQVLYNHHNFPQDSCFIAVDIRCYTVNEASSLPVRKKINTEHQPEVETKNIQYTLYLLL